ncbi:hypothetical protein RUM44_005896 [Polyplax serrata]|uniref:Uncharacterized protein n=1 Tax=Polyplax serrata TaxID=468196 RepID=A0ABR1AYG0_POLSC
MGRYYNDSRKENNQCGSEVEKNKNQGRRNNAKREEKRHETVVKGRPQCFTLRKRRETEAEEKEKGGKQKCRKFLLRKMKSIRFCFRNGLCCGNHGIHFTSSLSPLGKTI